jgi:integrase
MHDLRHAHASWLLAGGADLKGVMDRMGQAQIQTTQKYLHTLPDTDQRNLDALTRTAGGSTSFRVTSHRADTYEERSAHRAE